MAVLISLTVPQISFINGEFTDRTFATVCTIPRHKSDILIKIDILEITMDCISILLLMAFGGSCGGVASAIAQNNVDNSYKVRVPFFLDKNTKEARLVPLGILGNIIIGATASISIFFVAVPLFNLKTSVNTPTNQQQRASHEDQAKLFSLSVAAGFAGIKLMESMAKRITDTVVSEKEQHGSKDAAIVKTETEENGKTTQTAMFLSQKENHKAISLAPTDITELKQKQVKYADNSANSTPANEEASSCKLSVDNTLDSEG